MATRAASSKGADQADRRRADHLWNAGNPTSPWHRQIPAYLNEDALKEMDAGGVDAAIRSPEGRHEPERAVGKAGGCARARDISQRGDEGDRRAELFRSALPVSRH